MAKSCTLAIPRILNKGLNRDIFHLSSQAKTLAISLSLSGKTGFFEEFPRTQLMSTLRLGTLTLDLLAKSI